MANFSQIIKNKNYLVFKKYSLFPFGFSCCQVIWWHLSFLNNFSLLSGWFIIAKQAIWLLWKVSWKTSRVSSFDLDVFYIRTFFFLRYYHFYEHGSPVLTEKSTQKYLFKWNEIIFVFSQWEVHLRLVLWIKT